MPLTVRVLSHKERSICLLLADVSLTKTTVHRTKPQIFRFRVGGQSLKIHKPVRLSSHELSPQISTEQWMAMGACLWGHLSLMELDQRHSCARPCSWVLQNMWVARMFITYWGTTGVITPPLPLSLYLNFSPLIVTLSATFYLNPWRLPQTLLHFILLASSCPVSSSY